MPDKYEECRLIGKELEDAVAQKLRELGMEVYQNAYVPRDSEEVPYSEVDLIAVSGSAIYAIECKNYSGDMIFDGATGQWSWRCGYKSGCMYSPIWQLRSHVRAIYEQLLCPVTQLIVVSDVTRYEGPELSYLVSLSELGDAIANLKIPQVIAPEKLAQARDACYTWAHPSIEVRRDHKGGVNFTRNRKHLDVFGQGIGVNKYCLSIIQNGEACYYYYTDELGRHWGIEKLESATLYDTEEEAREMSWQVPGAEVCTLELGYLENVDDLPGEFDGMTPDEIAYELGARPY